MDLLIPPPGLQVRVSILPNGRCVRVIEPINSNSGEAYRRDAASCGFGGVPASGEALAELKRERYGANNAVSGWGGQSKRRRRQRGTRGKSTATEDKEAAAAAAATATSCAICLDDFVDDDGLAVMPCAHRFHDACLMYWLLLSHLCPCCRYALPTEGEGDGEAEGGGAGAGANQGVQGEAATTTTRSTRARQANVRLFGPEWAADTSDDGLGLQQ